MEKRKRFSIWHVIRELAFAMLMGWALSTSVQGLNNPSDLSVILSILNIFIWILVGYYYFVRVFKPTWFMKTEDSKGSDPEERLP